MNLLKKIMFGMLIAGSSLSYGAGNDLDGVMESVNKLRGHHQNINTGVDAFRVGQHTDAFKGEFTRLIQVIGNLPNEIMSEADKARFRNLGLINQLAQEFNPDRRAPVADLIKTTNDFTLRSLFTAGSLVLPAGSPHIANFRNILGDIVRLYNDDEQITQALNPVTNLYLNDYTLIEKFVVHSPIVGGQFDVNLQEARAQLLEAGRVLALPRIDDEEPQVLEPALAVLGLPRIDDELQELVELPQRVREREIAAERDQQREERAIAAELRRAQVVVPVEEAQEEAAAQAQEEAPAQAQEELQAQPQVVVPVEEAQEEAPAQAQEELQAQPQVVVPVEEAQEEVPAQAQVVVPVEEAQVVVPAADQRRAEEDQQRAERRAEEDRQRAEYRAAVDQERAEGRAAVDQERAEGRAAADQRRAEEDQQRAERRVAADQRRAEEDQQRAERRAAAAAAAAVGAEERIQRAIRRAQRQGQ